MTINFALLIDPVDQGCAIVLIQGPQIRLFGNYLRNVKLSRKILIYGASCSVMETKNKMAVYTVIC
jgi:hypothetical protein